MSAAVLLGIAVLGGLGAVGRFLLDGAVAARAGRGFPWGTLAVNLSGAFALGLLTGAALSGDGLRLLGTGLIGAYTTFSTWAFETHRQAEDGRTRGALANLAVSLVLGLVCAWLGRRLGTAL
jgi:fluoride exporter